MVGRVRVDRLCDICWIDEEQEVAATHNDTIRIHNAYKALEWCDKCDDKASSIGQALDYFIVYGRRPEGLPEDKPEGRAGSKGNADQKRKERARNNATLQCPYCDAAPYVAQMYYDAHVAEHEGKDPDYICDVQGCNSGPNGSPKAYHTAQQLGVHKAQKHGITGPWSSRRRKEQAERVDN